MKTDRTNASHDGRFHFWFSYMFCSNTKQPSSLNICPWHSFYEGHCIVHKIISSLYISITKYATPTKCCSQKQQLILSMASNTQQQFQGFSTEGQRLAYTHHTELNFWWYPHVNGLHASQVYMNIIHALHLLLKIKRRIVHCCSLAVASICVLLICRDIFVVCLYQIRYFTEACFGFTV